MKIIELTQNTPEWLDFRRSHLGASDAPILMGVSPWCTPYQLFLRKLNLVPEQQETSAMFRGKRLEEEARTCFINMTGIDVQPMVGISDEHDWMAASFDGINLAYGKIVEIKCPGFDDHSKALNGQIPDKYYLQLQHQMYVAGLDNACYFSYFNGYGQAVNVNRDDEYINKMIEAEKEFYECLKSYTPPPLTNKDYKEKEDPIWASFAGQYKIVKENLKTLQAMEEELKKNMIGLCCGQSSKGEGVKASKILKKGTIDYASIPALKEIDLEQYRKPSSEYWKISIDGLNE